MLYSTTELGIYRVRIVCDIMTDLDREGWIMRVIPLEGKPIIKGKFGMYSLSAHGYYSSESIFKPQGDQTEIDYHLKIQANLPIPLGLRFMPIKLVNQIARNITQWRINEIAEGFIERSLHSFKGLESG